MNKGINKVILVGNVGEDPKQIDLEGDNILVSFPVATSEEWLDARTNEQVKRTEWHKIICFGATAHICKRYLTKGMKVYVEGKLQTRKYEKDGVTHYTTEVNIFQMQMLDKKQDDGSSQGGIHPDLL